MAIDAEKITSQMSGFELGNLSSAQIDRILVRGWKGHFKIT
jgi:hypothetical protein